MPSLRGALGLVGRSLSERITEISYDPKAVTSWENGDLSGKLRLVQKKMRTALRATLAGDIKDRSLKFIIHCSRRLGKTFLMLVDAIEIGLTELNAPLKFAGPTRKQIKSIVQPIFREITMDCPASLRPVWKASDHMYVFPKTLAQLTLEGCNNGHEENLRGPACRKGYVDEAQAFKDNLRYVVQDILMPQCISVNGSLVIAGTSPTTPVHDFVQLIQEGQLRGNYVSFPIEDAGYPPEVVAKFCEEAGGPESTTWLREYKNRILVDSKSAIIPEWKPAYEVEPPKDEYFPFYLKYDSLDIGGRKHRTVNLFAWYDFRRATVMVADEFGLAPPEMTTKALADGVKRKEVDIFAAHPLNLRVADNNNEILLRDLGSDHQLHFVATGKDTLEAMVNQVRLFVAAGRVWVSPRCKELIGCLRYGIWNEKRTDFKEFPEESDAFQLYGHFDALAALVYLVRNVNTTENPIPLDFKINRADMHVSTEALKRPDEEALRAALRPRHRR